MGGEVAKGLVTLRGSCSPWGSWTATFESKKSKKVADAFWCGTCACSSPVGLPESAATALPLGGAPSLRRLGVRTGFRRCMAPPSSAECPLPPCRPSGEASKSTQLVASPPKKPPLAWPSSAPAGGDWTTFLPSMPVMLPRASLLIRTWWMSGESTKDRGKAPPPEWLPPVPPAPWPSKCVAMVCPSPQSSSKAAFLASREESLRVKDLRPAVYVSLIVAPACGGMLSSEEMPTQFRVCRAFSRFWRRRSASCASSVMSLARWRMLAPASRPVSGSW
mmetsp:Transcript_5700/g.14735  ORF Transcript_5700/g.14735 Transcript_5700/m.14735 type:complete len:277 (-) Transcript_5700:445-1275(-)